ncbi:hypothetical protein R9X47_16435 [Wukongibacter baidiensis]|uniref:hypothetical protein n=1 Tax=Wukongibacter baidiensis TaxID=1723361 RepID=UPI003D7FAB9D
MKMKKNLKVLALGAVVALNLCIPAFANEVVEAPRGKNVSSGIQRYFSMQKMDPDQMKEMLEKSLEKLENAYEEGKIDEERYEAAKANIEEKLEKIENGDYSFMEAKPTGLKKLDPEQMKERLENALERLEEAYEEGKIDEEKYEARKAAMEENIEKIENGDYSFMQTKVISQRNLDPEQMKERLENALERLEEAYEEGKIDEEKYEAKKAAIEENIEKIENGDYSFIKAKGLSQRNLDPEQMKEKLELLLEKLEEAYEEGKIDEERYEARKTLIEEKLEELDN